LITVGTVYKVGQYSISFLESVAVSAAQLQHCAILCMAIFYIIIPLLSPTAVAPKSVNKSP